MGARFKGFKFWVVIGGVLLAALLLAAAFVQRDDILRTALDPKVPYQTYRPPAAPDYAQPAAWALLPRDPGGPAAADRPADVFFVHPTTYDGGREWNAPLDDPKAQRRLDRTVLPNYAGPFARVGRIFAPRYRQASLYTSLTLRDDAREARRFAYGDVRAAFRLYVARYNQGRPFVLVGVEQGGTLAARLLRDEIAPDPALRTRLAGAYLIETVVPRDAFGPQAMIPACHQRGQAGCVVAWASLTEGDFSRAQALTTRALVWDDAEQLVELNGRPPLCVNPLLGMETDERAPARLNLGAANATGLEWGARPAFLKRQIAAHCEGGLLYTSRPKSSSLRDSGSWADRRKVDSFNLFYADIEADALARLAALKARPAPQAPAKP
jgi:hypothetical protein